MPDLVMVMVNMTKTLKPVPATKTKLTANDANLPRVSKIYSIKLIVSMNCVIEIE